MPKRALFVPVLRELEGALARPGVAIYIYYPPPRQPPRAGIGHPHGPDTPASRRCWRPSVAACPSPVSAPTVIAADYLLLLLPCERANVLGMLVVHLAQPCQLGIYITIISELYLKNGMP